MENVIALAIGQYNGTFAVTGEIAATGNYSVGQGTALVAFSGEVESLGKFEAALDDNTMKYKLEPAAADKAADLMEAAIAIEALIKSGFAVDTPVISGDETFEESTEVSISVPTRSEVYYTTDGSTPTSGSTKYTEPFTLDATTTVQAIAIKDEVSSAVESKTFTKSSPAAESQGE